MVITSFFDIHCTHLISFYEFALNDLGWTVKKIQKCVLAGAYGLLVLVMADMLWTCLVKMAVYWLLSFSTFINDLHSVSDTYIFELFLWASISLWLRKVLSMLLIFNNSGVEGKMVRVGTPGQRPVLSRKALWEWKADPPWAFLYFLVTGCPGLDSFCLLTY